MMLDVDELAGYVKNALVKFLTNLLYTNLVATLPWTGLPVLGPVIRWVIERGVIFAATKGGLVAFMINTNVFTASQAKDFIKAIEDLANASDDIPDEEWEKLEDKANSAFERLVRFNA